MLILSILCLVIGASAGAFFFPRVVEKKVTVEVIKEVPVEKIVEVEKIVNVCSPKYIVSYVKTKPKKDPKPIVVGNSSSLNENDIATDEVDMNGLICKNRGYNSYVIKNGVSGNYMCENHFNGYWSNQYNICCVDI